MSNVDPPTQQSTTLSFADLVPSQWFNHRGTSSLWISGYRMLQVPPHQPTETKLVDLEHVRLIFMRGKLSYTDASAAKIEVRSERDWYFDASKVQEVVSPDGAYLLILTPHNVDGKPGSEPEIRDHVRSAVGLVATFFTKAAVFQHLFDNILELEPLKTSAFSPSIESPLWYPIVDISDSGIERITTLNSLLLRRPVSDRNRVYLALRWIQSAIEESDSIDKFIKYWVAIETLAMRDTSNVKAVNALLSREYGTDIAAIQRNFESADS